MAESFDDILADRSVDKLAKQLNEINAQSKGDSRFWKPTQDKAGNGSAIIRFLDRSEGEKTTVVSMITHQFDGPTGQRYNENSLLTLGKPDPVDDMNKKLWKEKTEESEAQARSQKKQVSYISNIYVIRDPAKPENEGKVFLYRYGKKIYDKINRKANPAIEGIPRVNVFHMAEGDYFHLIVYRTATGEGGWPNYDQSEFGPQRPLFVDSTGQPDAAKMKEVWAKQYKLSELVAPDKFKSYAELKSRLSDVLGVRDESLPPFDIQQAPSAGKIMAPKGVDDGDMIVEEEDDPDLQHFEELARGA